MSLLQAHDVLPFIDPALSESELAAAKALLADSTPNDTQALHPSIPTAYEPSFSPLLLEAHERIRSTGDHKTPSGSGIDLSRYGEPTAPSDPADHEAWRQTLRQAYISQQYLVQRNTNLSLLERFGRNAWLISNAQVEDELRSLEKELVNAQKEAQAIEDERKVQQANAHGELEGLQEAWKLALGRAIEAEVAIEGLKRDILDAQRSGVSG